MKHTAPVPTVEGLESRRHFAVSYVEVAPVNSTVTTQTLLVLSDAVGDTINLTCTPNGAGAAFAYNFTGTSLPATGVNANDFRLFGGGRNDIITVTKCFGGWVSGSVGDDKITLINCQRVQITPLQASDTGDGQAPAPDGDDTIDLQNSVATNADGGTGVDKFTASGTNSSSILTGGPGLNDFAVGGTFINGQLYGGPDRDVVSGSGNWDRAMVVALGGNDWIDLRPCTGTMSIHGGAGDDRMWAGSEGSTMSGGDGWDWMTGGAGDDWFYAVDGQMDVISGGGQVQGDYAQIDYPNFDTGNDTDWINGIEFVDYKFYP